MVKSKEESNKEQYTGMKERVNAAAPYACICPLGSTLHILPAGTREVRQHEKTKGHRAWLAAASQEQKDLLERIRCGDHSAVMAADSDEVGRLRAKFNQWLISEGLSNTAAVQEEHAWRFILRELGAFDSAAATRQTLYDFWCTVCFPHTVCVEFNNVSPRPSPSFVFQLIAGKHGVRVCKTWGSKSSSTHTVDGVPIIVKPGMAHNLIKVMTFDLTTNNSNGVPQLPYQFIESTPKSSMAYVYAFVHISGKPHYTYRSVWETTLQLFGWDVKDSSSVGESYSGDEYLKLSSRFAVEMETLERDIIPLYIYYLKVRVSADEDWSKRVSCGLRGQLIADRSPSLDGLTCFAPLSSSKSIDVEILTSLVTPKDDIRDRSFTRPNALLSAMYNKSSYYPFKTKGCEIVALTCDNDGKPTWEIGASSSVVRDRILPILRDSGEEFHAVFIDRVRRFERVEIPFVEIHLYGIGSQCSQCTKPAPVYIEQKGQSVSAIWVKCRACNAHTKITQPRYPEMDQLRAVPRDYAAEDKLFDLLRELISLKKNPEEALKAKINKKELRKLEKEKAEAERQLQESERLRQEAERQEAERQEAEERQRQEAKRQRKEEEKQGGEPKKKKRKKAKEVQHRILTWEEAQELIYGKSPEELKEEERQREQVEEARQHEEKRQHQQAARQLKEEERRREYERQRQEDDLRKKKQIETRDSMEPKIKGRKKEQVQVSEEQLRDVLENIRRVQLEQAGIEKKEREKLRQYYAGNETPAVVENSQS